MKLPPIELVLTPQEKTRAAVIALDLERIRRKRNALDAKRQRDATAIDVLAVMRDHADGIAQAAKLTNKGPRDAILAGLAEFNEAIAAVAELIERDQRRRVVLATCERWFAQHSPTAPLIGGLGGAEHPMLTMLRDELVRAGGVA